MKKRLIITSIFILTCVMSWGAAAVGTAFTVDGNVYNVTKISPAECSLQSISSTSTGDILVATSVSYGGVEYSVTGVGPQAFNKAGIRSVVLPEGVRETGSYTFSDKATDLRAIYLPATLTKFYPNYLCSYIAKIVVASGNEKYETNADGSVLIDKTNNHLLVATSRTVNATSDGTAVFTSSDDWSVTELKTITIPEDVVYMDASSIKGSNVNTTRATTISLPSTLTGFDGNCWGTHIHGWNTIKVADGNENFTAVDGILYSADGTKLYKVPVCKYHGFTDVVEIAGGVVEIEENAFQNSEIYAVKFPSSVTTIADNAFLSCTNLTSVTLGAGVASVSSNSFAKCTKLANIYVDQANPKYTNGSYTGGVGDGILYGPGETTDELKAWEAATDETNPTKAQLKIKHLMTCPAKRTGICTVPDNCKVIDKQAFYNSNITTVNLGKDVVEIGEQAFFGAQLTAIDLHPDLSTSGVTTLGISAFNDAKNLATVNIGANVTEIPQKCFAGCNVTTFTWETPSECTKIASSSLTGVNVGTLTIPSSVESVRENPFSTSTTNVIFADDNGGSHLKEVIGSFSGKTNIQVVFGSLAYDETSEAITGSFTPAEGSTFTINGGFKSSGLTSMTLPVNCSSLTNSAFMGCTDLKHVYFESGSKLRVIGNGVFANTGLLDISLPDGLKTVESSAFENCTAMEEVHVPATTTSIDPLAFNGCSSLTNIDVDAANTVYATSDGMLLTKNKEKLVIYPNGKASDDFNLLTPSLTEIGEKAFYAAKKLTSIVMPKKLATIGNHAFYLCDNLKEITFLGDRPANVEKDAANDEIAAAAWKASHPSSDTSYKNYKDHRFGTGIDQTPAEFLAGVTINIRKNDATVESFTDQVTFTDSKGESQTVDPYWKGASVRRSFEATNGTRTATAEEKAADPTKDFNQFEYLFFGPSTLGVVKGNSTNNTAVVPASAVWPDDGKSYPATIIADYAFEDMPSTVKEVVFQGPISYIGANAFNNGHADGTYTAEPESSIENIFFTDKESAVNCTFATSRFELNTTEGTTAGYMTENYPEFTSEQNIYVPKSKLDTYKGLVAANVANQVKYQIPFADTNMPGTFGTLSREFDVDLKDTEDDATLLDVNNDACVIAFTGRLKDDDIKDTEGKVIGVHMRSINYSGSSLSFNATESKQSNENDGTYIPANTGVLLKAYNGGQTYYRIGEKTVTAPSNVFKPVVENATSINGVDGSDTNYYVTGKGYKKAGTDTAIEIHNAYMNITGGSLAKGIRLIWDDEESDATAIDAVETAAEAETVVYDLAGRRIGNSAAKHGVYVVNNKKMFIK